MPFKLDRYFVAGILAGALILLMVFRLKSNEPDWISQLENLGMVERIGSGLPVLVIRSYACATCRDLEHTIGPIMRNRAMNGQISLITVDSPEQNALSETILATKWRLAEMEPDALPALHDALIENYADLKTNQDLNLLLMGLGFKDFPLDSLEVQRAKKAIRETRSVINEIGVHELPVWIVNGRAIHGETADDYLTALTIELGRLTLEEL